MVLFGSNTGHRQLWHGLEHSEHRIILEIQKAKDELTNELRSSLERFVDNLDSRDSIKKSVKEGTRKSIDEPQLDRFTPRTLGMHTHWQQTRFSSRELTNLLDKAPTREKTYVCDIDTLEEPGVYTAANIMSTYVNLEEEQESDMNTNANPEFLIQDMAHVREGFRRHVSAKRRNWCLASMVASTGFDNLTSLIVVANAIFIGIEVDTRCQHRSDLPDWWDNLFNTVRNGFLLIFFVEWILRIIVAGPHFFSCQTSGCHWNWLDTVTVSVQIVEWLLLKLAHEHRVLKSGVGSMRIWRMLRLLRICRVLRLLHLSDDLGMLTHAIVRSLSTVCWALLLLITLVYAVGVSFAERMCSFTNVDVPERVNHYFRDVPRSMLTLVESILGGLSWDEPARALFEEVGIISGFAFIVFVFLGFFILCNVVTGVFNEGVARSSEAELSRQHAVTLQLALEMPDATDPDAMDDLVEKVTWQEWLDKVLYDEHMRAYLRSINIEPSEISAKKVFGFLDVNGNREVTRAEVFYGCLKLREPARAVDISLLMHNMMEIRNGLSYCIGSINRIHSHYDDDGGTPAEYPAE